jgi:hypothetical protein
MLRVVFFYFLSQQMVRTKNKKMKLIVLNKYLLIVRYDPVNRSNPYELLRASG